MEILSADLIVFFYVVIVLYLTTFSILVMGEIVVCEKKPERNEPGQII